MAQKKLKSISEIISSTNTVKGRGSSSLGQKQFGAILAYNKLVLATPGGTTIIVSMMIKGLTDKLNGKPVAAHRVLIAVSGVKYEHYTATELVAKIRAEIPKYKDEEKFPFMDLIKMVQEQNIKFFHEKTILPTKDRTYVVINNKISTDAKMQVHCSCSDYFWTFQWYNVDENVDLYGVKPPPYRYSNRSSAKRLTGNGKQFSMAGKRATSSTVSIRNPGKAFGMCKHILLLLGMLMDEEVVAPSDPSNQGSESPAVSYKLNVDRFKKEEHISYREYNDLINKFSKDAKKMVARREYLSGAEKGTISRTYFNPDTMRIEKSTKTFAQRMNGDMGGNKTFAQKLNPNIGKKKFKP